MNREKTGTIDNVNRKIFNIMIETFQELAPQKIKEGPKMSKETK